MIPLEIEDGLPYVKGRPYTDDEWLKLPHVELTSPGDWDPSILDHKLSVEEMMRGSKVPMPTDIVAHPDYDIEGNLVNDGIDVHVSDVASTAGDPSCDTETLQYDTKVYGVEGFTKDELPIFNINTTTASNDITTLQSDSMYDPGYTTSTVDCAILCCCLAGFNDHIC